MRTLFAAAFILVSSSGCLIGKECNLMYAPDNLEIHLATPLSDAGEWEISVEGSDGYAVTCAVTLPASDSASASCDDGIASLHLSAANDAIEGVLLFGAAPPTVVVTAALDGVEVGSGEATPSYDIDEPNGEGCGERSTGSVTVTLETAS